MFLSTNENREMIKVCQKVGRVPFFFTLPIFPHQIEKGAKVNREKHFFEDLSSNYLQSERVRIIVTGQSKKRLNKEGRVLMDKQLKQALKKEIVTFFQANT